MFEKRSTEREFLDSPDCDPALASESYRFMEKVNRFFGGTRNVRRFIEKEFSERKSSSPLRILDIGSGSCDIPIAVSRWAESRGIPVKFTCLEVFDSAVKIARAKIAESGVTSVELLQEDVFTHHPDEPYDYAVASMCFHHFEDEMILGLIQKIRTFVKHGVLINDLHRSLLTWLGAVPLTAFSHEGVKHDSRLSIRRGFKIRELRRLLMRLDGVTVSVKPTWLFRVSATVRFEGEQAQISLR
ncbi:MAG: methyltransferase domain-containing protein [Victivallales bacterium]